MKEILLTQNQVALVDDEDFEWLSQWRWTASYNPKTDSFYAKRKESGCNVFMSREIMKCPSNMKVDHASHDTLDNRRYNLRICINTQNSWNQKKTKSLTSSRYKGVTWCKRDRRWHTQIHLRDVFDRLFHLHLGGFDIEEEAALAYDDAAVKHFGEFAYLNFPR